MLTITPEVGVYPPRQRLEGDDDDEATVVDHHARKS